MNPNMDSLETCLGHQLYVCICAWSCNLVICSVWGNFGSYRLPLLQTSLTRLVFFNEMTSDWLKVMCVCLCVFVCMCPHFNFRKLPCTLFLWKHGRVLLPYFLSSFNGECVHAISCIQTIPEQSITRFLSSS